MEMVNGSRVNTNQNDDCIISTYTELSFKCQGLREKGFGSEFEER